MQVNNINFCGLAKTQNGNLYEKKNTWKNVGTALGLTGGAALAYTSDRVNIYALDLATLFTKNILKLGNIQKGILGAGIILMGLAGRMLGAIPDHIINKKRIAKADNESLQK